MVEPTPVPEGAAEPFGAFAFSTTPGAAYVRRPSGSNRLWLIGGGAALAVVALAAVLVLALTRGNGQRTTDGGVAVNPDGDNKEVAAKKQLDLSYIAGDFNAAVIVHPSRILERPFVAKMLEDKTMAGFIDPIGFDPRKLEQLIVVVDLWPSADVPAMPGWIARSTEPWEETEFFKRMSGVTSKTVTFAGKEYLARQTALLAKRSIAFA
jgi:hypothetical protein